VVAVALDRDAAALLVSQVDFGISAWRLPAAQFAVGFAPPPAVVVPVVEAPHPEAPNAVVIRPDGQEAVVALENRLIRYAMASGQVVRALAGPGGIVRAAAYSPDGATLLVSAFYNPAAYLLDAADGHVRQRFPVEREASAVAFANDGRSVAVGTQAGPVALFAVGTDAPPRVLSGARSAVRALAFVGDRLVAAGDDGVLRVWDPTSGALIVERQLAPTLHAITVNGERGLVAATGDTKIQLVTLADGTTVSTLEGHSAQVLSLAWVASTLVSGDAGGRVALWDVAVERGTGDWGLGAGRDPTPSP
jgi:WD40 repeat protein